MFLKLFQVKNWIANETGIIAPASFSPVVFLVNFASGKIVSFHVASDVSAGAANLFSGIASMFQYQADPTEVVESDVTGDCVARYIAGKVVYGLWCKLFTYLRQY